MISTEDVTNMLRQQVDDLTGAIQMTELILNRQPFKGDKLLALQLQKFLRQKARLINRIQTYESFGGVK